MTVKNTHDTPPKGKPTNRSAYADPSNYKWPIDEKHIRAAVGYYNHGNSSGYSSSQWATIGHRIASAARRIIGGAYKLVSGKVTRGDTSGQEEDGLRFESAADVIAEFTHDDLEGLLRYFASDEARHLDDAETDDEAYVDDSIGAASLPFTHGKGGAGLSSVDPDGDGDDDTTPEGDSDHDAFPRRGRPSSRRARGAEEWTPTHARVVAEETTVNGVPCFQFEAMLIPGDAISRNTVPGKKGPTYYSARRIRQYVGDNSALLEEMRAKGQRVTIYPRHAAALLDAALPAGWVERYETRPSSERPGIEDAWYVGCIPLTTEGRDILMKMRTGLTQFSSLRTFSGQDGRRFETQPVKVNGQLVEEATRLPIAGVDLVATAPGLPVKPIRILEEAIIETVEDADTLESPAPTSAGTEEGYMSGPAPRMAPPQGQQQQPQQGQQQQMQQQGQQPQQGQQAAGNANSGVPQQYANCPHCGGDIGMHVAAAHVAMNHATQQQQAQQQPQGQQPPNQQQRGAPPMTQNGPREEALATENATLKERVAALEAEIAKRAETPAPAAEETPAVRAAQLKIEALEKELAGVEELRQWKAQQELRAAKATKLSELVAGDTRFGAMMRPIIEEKIDAIPSLEELELTYWRVRRERTDQLFSKRAQQATGYGYVHAPATSGASEEEGAGAPAGLATPAPQPTAGAKPFNSAQEEMRQMFARIG